MEGCEPTVSQWVLDVAGLSIAVLPFVFLILVIYLVKKYGDD